MGEILESRGGRLALAAVCLSLLVAVGLGAWRLATGAPASESIAAEAARARGGTAPPADPGAAAAPAAKVALVTVFVSGEVTQPGVYRLPRGARVADAIEAAGGLLPDADTRKLPNLAGRVSDGKQVKVPRRGSTTAAASRVDINSATVEELAGIPGIDEATAQAIVDQREGYGPFISLTELHTLLGLDVQVVAGLRGFLRVGAP